MRRPGTHLVLKAVHAVDGALERPLGAAQREPRTEDVDERRHDHRQHRRAERRSREPVVPVPLAVAVAG